MSSKTTFKRIALVAVAALGLGVVSTVAPANATARTASSIVVGTIPSARVGATAYVPVKVYLPSAAVAADTITVNAEVTAAPIMGGTSNAASDLGPKISATNSAGALLGLSDTNGSLAFANSTAVYGRVPTGRNAAITSGTPTGSVASSAPSYILQAADITAGYKTVYVAITPDVAGSYTVLVSTNSGTTTYYTAGDVSSTFTLTTGAAPTSVTLTVLGGGTTINSSAPNGVAVAVDLVGGTLAGVETLNLSTSGSGSIGLGSSATAVSPSSWAATQALTASNFVGNRAYVWLKDAATAAETISLTATGAAGVSSSVTATKTFSVVIGSGSASTYLTLEAPSADAVYAMTNATTDGATNPTYTVTQLSTSQSIGLTSPASMTAQKGYYTVTDTAGLLSGVAGLVYDVATSFAATTAASGTTISFAANAASVPAASALFNVAIPAGASGTLGLASAKTIYFVTAARTNTTISVSPTTTILAAPGAAIALTATLKDQFGAARSSQTVTVTTSGRNNPAASTLVTDASGKVTFTTSDASTSTTNLVDTVTFTAGSASKSVTINYANTAVSTVTVTGGNTTASVTAATQSVNAISAGDGAEAGAIGITATVKDASGNALAGVPVSFSVAGTGVAFKSTSATVYTGSTGTAVGSLYAWIAGTYTYTVTAGGKTTTGTATFGNTTASYARVISASVSGSVVTGHAADRFGNPVSGVTLYAKTAAPANIGGVLVATATTDSNGDAVFVVSGAGDVTVSANDPRVVGSTFGQTCALAGNLTCAVPGTAAVAFTASTVGTATTAETYVGATYAPAGVASATVTTSDATSSDAVDAANEATDAANAATDAANAAAEAADAATAAAQDAQAAVAALATQVASLIAGIKAQITTLTNLVVKIQKKVKA